MDAVRSTLPQLKQGKQAHQGPHQVEGADPVVPQGPDQALEADATAPLNKAAGPRLPARFGKGSVPYVNRGQVLVSKTNQHPPDHAAAPQAAPPQQQLPEEEQHASELQRHSAVSASQARGSGQPSKKKKARKEKKRKHKHSSAAQEGSSAHWESSSLAGGSERGRSLSLEPSSAAAAAAAAAANDQNAMVRCWHRLIHLTPLSLFPPRPPPPPTPDPPPSSCAFPCPQSDWAVNDPLWNTWAAERSWSFCSGVVFCFLLSALRSML